MNTSAMTTLKASLIASAIGTGAWFFGITRLISPEHPMLADLIITIAATFLFMRLLCAKAE